MKHLTSLFYPLFIMLITSCAVSNNTNEEVERITLEPEIICNAVITKFPGTLLVNNKYAVLEDPFANEFFMDIYDLKTGEKLAKIGKLGRGPLEFTTPSIQYIKDDSIYVHDLNRNNHVGLLSIVSAISGEHDCKILHQLHNKEVSRVERIDDSTQIFLTLDENQLFALIEKGIKEKNSFGVPPIRSNITNGYNVFQGDISYHPENKLLVYTAIEFPYLAIYKKTNNSFILKTETGDLNPGEIRGDKLILDKKKIGIRSSVLALSYIICHQRDYSSDNMDESTVGRNFSKVPQTVFLYDYEGKLKKIVDLGYPVIRIASNPSSNDFYAVILNEEFQIVKYSL